MKIISKSSSIAKGYYYLFFKDDKVEEFARIRAEKCFMCNGSTWCKHCGCYLPAKVRSKKEQCPINKW